MVFYWKLPVETEYWYLAVRFLSVNRKNGVNQIWWNLFFQKIRILKNFWLVLIGLVVVTTDFHICCSYTNREIWSTCIFADYINNRNLPFQSLIYIFSIVIFRISYSETGLSFYDSRFYGYIFIYICYFIYSVKSGEKQPRCCFSPEKGVKFVV